ncbi:chloride channel protein, partial [bacterium]|nr:chloride channel protein [bacterium]
MLPHNFKNWDILRRPFISSNILLREFIFALIVGAVTAIAAIIFEWLIRLVYACPAGILTVALGGLIVGIIHYNFVRNLDGISIPGVIMSVFKKGGHVHGRVAFISMLSSAITIGTGGSAGKEGPIVEIGASLGSKIAQILHLGKHRTIILLACGVAAGISSAFNAPIAGIFFALEIILTRLKYHYFCLIVVSSSIACLITRAWIGNIHEFAGFSYLIHNDFEIGLFLGLGILAGFVGVGFARSLFTVENLFS